MIIILSKKYREVKRFFMTEVLVQEQLNPAVVELLKQGIRKYLKTVTPLGRK